MSEAPSRRVLIVEPDTAGHHSFWLVLTIGAFQRAGWSVGVLGDLEHATVREQARLRGVKLELCERYAVDAGATSARALVGRAAELVSRNGYERVFFAFLDNLWPAFLDMPSDQSEVLAGRVAGVWFHPYALDAGWRWAPPFGKRWALRGRLHRFFRTERAARLFSRVFFLDPAAVTRAGAVNADVRADLLPDPFEGEPRLSMGEARRALGLPEGRTVFLHLGTAEKRKGLPDLIDALERLATRDAGGWTRPPLLVRVGKNQTLSKADRARLAKLEAAGSAVVREAFVPAGELMEYFAASDWVLVPYRKFRFSSGIVANAVGAGRPVLASDHGCIGRAVREEHLGMVYRHGDVADLARAMEAAVVSGETKSAGLVEALARAKASREPGLFARAVARALD